MFFIRKYLPIAAGLKICSSRITTVNIKILIRALMVECSFHHQNLICAMFVFSL